jgi:UDP-N-acetylmuramoyl-tripeptide--D-alanyl-D-alanine ligase
MQFHLRDAAPAIGGTLVGPDVVCDGADFDSRTIRPGQLFVPVEAERDGHDFIDVALERGAAAYLTRREPRGGSAIVVDDTAAALLRLGAWARGRSTDQVVGITGSVGKTSTKDLATAAVGVGRRVWSNRRSFNNDQGLPVTILDAPDDTEVLIVEMGMRGFGEITRLCGIARPRVGVVTAVAEAHSERVGGVAGVQRAKGELVRALPAGGVAVLNADDAAVRAMASWSAAPVLTYGHDPSADVRFRDVVLDEPARPRCQVDSPWGQVEVVLSVPGRHMLANAAAALAVAGIVGVPLADAASALASARLSPMRMELSVGPSGVLVLDDSYNANPTSMRAALTSLAELPGARHVAVLGLMAELDEPERHHEAIAAMAGDLGIELVAVGTDLYGVAPIPVDDAAADAADGDVVLVKGSRVAGLDRVARRLLGRVG